MPIGEIAGEFLGGVLRFLSHFLGEIIIEIVIRGAGYFICRFFKKDVDPDGALVLIAGLAFWVVLCMVIYFAYSFISTQIAIDSCLDSGGSFNHTTNQCIHSKALSPVRGV